MKNAFLMILLLAIVPSAKCQSGGVEDDHWFKVVEDEVVIFSARRGSLEVVQESDRNKLASAIFRLENKDSGRISFYKYKVSDSDCNKGYGIIKLTALDDTLISSSGFVKDGGDNGSAIALSLCIAMRTRTAAEGSTAEKNAEAQADK